MTQTEQLIHQWRRDTAATYQTWFLWPERLKNFRAIRRGIQQVVQEIEADNFGTAYKGSSLETIVHSIAEQRQMFKGADHAFLWKPKLRIPDIYEHRNNQIAFGRLLHHCCECTTGGQIIDGIHRIDAIGIKGLGPAVANLIYFLHPTEIVPFNTAIVRGFNALTGARVKLGSWTHYLTMLDAVKALNEQYRPLLSNDLGAVAALLFDVGSGRYPAPEIGNLSSDSEAWSEALAAAKQEAAAFAKSHLSEAVADRTHCEIQAWLRDLGKSLGYRVWIAANDRSRVHAGAPLAEGCLTDLPRSLQAAPGAESVRLIDVLWLDGTSDKVAAAFEVEHSTSIYSGIVRMLDLALSGDLHLDAGLFLVAPDKREADVRAQLARPAFRRISDLDVRYLSYSELERHREAIGRFGSGLKAIESISVRLT